MMRYIVFFFSVFSIPCFGQFDSTAYYLAQTIEPSQLKTYIYALASDKFEGRETGTEGNAKAYRYIADQFQQMGIPPVQSTGSYLQNVAFSSYKWSSIEMQLSGENAEHLKDFLCIPQNFPYQTEQLDISSFIFLGYGIDDPLYSDYNGVNVAGKHLMIYAGEPRKSDGNFRLTGTEHPSDWSGDLSKKLQAAKNAGAASLWIMDDQFRLKVMDARRKLMGGELLMGSSEELSTQLFPHFIISSTFAQRLLDAKTKKVIKTRDKITKTGKPARTTIPVDLHWKGVQEINNISSANVLGFIEGTDPVLKDELVAVTAHFDHMGKRGDDIFYGADDNASGTSAVLEIAEALSIAKAKGQGPRRSVLCMLVTGEEKGLLGSQYYTEHPIFPLKNTIANVNIDMIGRMDNKHDQPNYTYVIGADRLSTELHDINESVNALYTHLALDYEYNEDSDPNRFYYRSDHYNFAKNGIPAVFYFSGVHEDYHRPTDTPDKIMFDKAATIAKLAFHTAWELANRNDRIKVNVTGRN